MSPPPGKGRRFRGGRTAVTLRSAAAALGPAQGSVVGGLLQGEGAHHRLAEELGPADLLLPVLLQGQRWLLRLLLLPQFESCPTDGERDEGMRGVNAESAEVIGLTEEVCDPRDLRLVLQLRRPGCIVGQRRYAGCQIYKRGQDAAF